MARLNMTVRWNKHLLNVFSNSQDVVNIYDDALRKAATHWLTNFLPRHFDRDALARYPGAYVERAKGTEARKRKRHPENAGRPMAFTGAMERKVLSGPARMEFRTTKTMMRIRVRPPTANAINLWSGGRKHDFVQSLTAISQEEEAILAKLVERCVSEDLERYLENCAMSVFDLA